MTAPYGFDAVGSTYGRPRGIIDAPDTSPNGNLALRVGKELKEGGWTRTVHCVLSPQEGIEFAHDVLGALGESHSADLLAIGWLVAYWALGRDPDGRDAEFISELREIVGGSSIPDAAQTIGQTIMERTPDHA